MSGLGFNYPGDDTRYNDAYVTWLMHFDTVGGTLPAATNLIDYSWKKNGRMAVSDNCQFTAGTGIGGSGTSIYFPNNALAYSPVNIDNSFNLATNDFTIDWWEYAVGGDTGTYHPSFVWDTLSNVYAPMLVGWGDSTALYFYASNDAATWNLAVSVPMGARQMNTWAHRALVRKGGIFYTFQNGILQATASIGGNGVFNNATYGPCLGCWPRNDGYIYFWGYIDEFRVSNGIARWTSNFSLPAAYDPLVIYKPDPDPSPRVEPTVLLMHFDGDFKDSSQKRHGTGQGNAVISTAVKKFGNSSAIFSNAQYTYFQDSPDFDFGTGDFTLDCWIYNMDATNAVQHALFGQMAADLTNLSMGALLNTTNCMYCSFGKAGSDWYTYKIVGVIPVTPNAWHHYAIVRQGNIIKQYLDGVLDGPPLDFGGSSVFNSTGIFVIGALGQASYYWQGCIDEFRLTKGEALWTANFTPPTQPGS